MKSFATIFLLILGIFGAQAQEKVVALHPKRLLELLPPAEAGWVMKASHGYQEFAEHPNVVTMANRKYLYTFPEDYRAKQGDSAPPPPLEVAVRIFDSAYTPGEMALIEQLYAEEKTMVFTEEERWRTVAGEPLVIAKDEGMHYLLFGVKKRFWIAADLKGLDEKQVESWIQRLNLRGISDALSAEKTVRQSLKDGRRFDLFFYDEIDPRRTRTNSIVYAEWMYKSVLEKK